MQSRTPSYYEILKISTNASNEEIEQAYRNSPELVETAAYQALINPVMRYFYDLSIGVTREPPLLGSELDQLINRALRDAVITGDTQQIQIFILHKLIVFPHTRKIPLPESNEIEKNIYYFAAQSGRLEVLQLLIGKMIIKMSILDRGVLDDALLAAVANRRTDIAKYLLGLGADVNICFRKEESAHEVPDTLLIRALKDKNDEMIQLLIGHNAWIEDSLRHTRWDLSQQDYPQVIKILFDYMSGIDIKTQGNIPELNTNPLSFLRPRMNVAGFNFLGVSIDGKPITRTMLRKAKLEGVDQAIVTERDLEALSDLDRKQKIKQHITQLISKRGKLLTEEGNLNLIPLHRAVYLGDLPAVKARLAVEGVDPSHHGEERIKRTEKPIVTAVERNHLNIVMEIAQHPNTSVDSINQAIRRARSANKFSTVYALENFKKTLAPAFNNATTTHVIQQKLDTSSSPPRALS